MKWIIDEGGVNREYLRVEVMVGDRVCGMLFGLREGCLTIWFEEEI